MSKCENDCDKYGKNGKVVNIDDENEDSTGVSDDGEHMLYTAQETMGMMSVMLESEQDRRIM